VAGGMRTMTGHHDDYGFWLEGMEVSCTHCPAGGQSSAWPQWKRVQHYEANHKREVMTAKAVASAATASADAGPLPESVRRLARRHLSKQWQALHEPRPCRECGGAFERANARQVFCSPKCRKRNEQLRRKTRDALPPQGGLTTSHAVNGDGPSLVTNGGSPPPECANCGEPFRPRRTDQKFCSNACRQAAHRAKHAQQPQRMEASR
jgi:predicted Zn-ribbon and HTH transcriptional regulator